MDVKKEVRYRFMTEVVSSKVIFLSPFVYMESEAADRLRQFTRGRKPVLDLRRVKCIYFECTSYPSESVFNEEYEQAIDEKVHLAELGWRRMKGECTLSSVEEEVIS